MFSMVTQQAKDRFRAIVAAGGTPRSTADLGLTHRQAFTQPKSSEGACDVITPELKRDLRRAVGGKAAAKLLGRLGYDEQIDEIRQQERQNARNDMEVEDDFATGKAKLTPAVYRKLLQLIEESTGSKLSSEDLSKLEEALSQMGMKADNNNESEEEPDSEEPDAEDEPADLPTGGRPTPGGTLTPLKRNAMTMDAAIARFNAKHAKAPNAKLAERFRSRHPKFAAEVDNFSFAYGGDTRTEQQRVLDRLPPQDAAKARRVLNKHAGSRAKFLERHPGAAKLGHAT